MEVPPCDRGAFEHANMRIHSERTRAGDCSVVSGELPIIEILPCESHRLRIRAQILIFVRCASCCCTSRANHPRHRWNRIFSLYLRIRRPHGCNSVNLAVLFFYIVYSGHCVLCIIYYRSRVKSVRSTSLSEKRKRERERKKEEKERERTLTLFVACQRLRIIVWCNT